MTNPADHAFRRARIKGLRSRTKPVTRDRARRMRKNQTPAERAAWAVLKGGGRGSGRPKWHRQAIIRGYVADFYCPKARLILELDGAHHQADPDQRAHDQLRTQVIRSLGIEVSRLTNAQVLGPEAPVALANVLDLATRRTAQDQPRKEGE